MHIRKMRMEDYDPVYALWLSCPGMGLNNLLLPPGKSCRINRCPECNTGTDRKNEACKAGGYENED